MKLIGAFQGYKQGEFKPEDGDGSTYPYVFGKVTDEDGDGGYTKVKPMSSDADDLAVFAAVCAAAAKGSPVAWAVRVDNYGNVRYIGSLK